MLNPNTLLESLEQGQYAQLNAYLLQLQADFEAGRVGEEALMVAFSQFDSPDPGLEKRFEEWLDAYPHSYVALVALGNWLVRMGGRQRGGQRAYQVSDQGFRGMYAYFAQAQAVLSHAVSQTENPLMAWLLLGGMDGAQGARLTPEDLKAHRYPEWYMQGISASPQSLLLRRYMLGYLRAEWGGSEEMMLQFVRQQQEEQPKTGLSNATMQKLWSSYHANIAHYAWMFQDDMVKAQENAEISAQLNPRTSDILFGILTELKAPTPQREQALLATLTTLETDPTRDVSYTASALADSINKELVAAHSARIGAALLQRSERGEVMAARILNELRKKQPKLNLPDPTAALEAMQRRGDREAAEYLARQAENTPGTPREVVMQRTFDAAALGSAEYCYDIFLGFPEYQERFTLDDRAMYHYLLQSADGGNNTGRYILARLLLSGQVELGQDGVLRPVDTQPIQESLDYAKYLLERAAREDYEDATKLLKQLQPGAWEAATAVRRPLMTLPGQESVPASAATPDKKKRPIEVVGRVGKNILRELIIRIILFLILCLIAKLVLHF